MVIGGEGWAGGWGGQILCRKSHPCNAGLPGRRCPVPTRLPAALRVCSCLLCPYKDQTGRQVLAFPTGVALFPIHPPLRVFFLLDSVTHKRSHAPTHLFSPQPCLCGMYLCLCLCTPCRHFTLLGN